MNRKWLMAVPAIMAGAVLVGTLMSNPQNADSVRRPSTDRWVPQISSMGAIARGDVPRPTAEQMTPRPGQYPAMTQRTAVPNGGTDVIVHDPSAIDFQSENVVAVNGNTVVVAYNDMRGFGVSPTSVCGFSYSSDGGTSFTDGGQLPTAGGGDEVLGDPDVKHWFDGASTNYFFYSSLYETASGDNSLCLHVSTNGGQTWTAPRVVTPATSATDFADKPLMDVDPETGRILLAWTNFGTFVTVRCAYSDDRGQTWSAATEFPSIGQGAVPRFGESSTVAYVAWLSGGTIQLAKSVDNGATFATPFTVVDNVVVPRAPYGSDRVNSFPSLALNGPSVYLAYAATAPSAKGNSDFSDIYFVKSDDAGVTFSAPSVISSNGFVADAAQFFPYVAVDQITNNIAILYYDQARGDLVTPLTTNADLTDVVVAVSTNGGTKFQCGVTLSDRPFHAETGNTTTSANLGEYSQCVFNGGVVYAAFTKTSLPSSATSAPDTYFDTASPTVDPQVSARINLVTFTESGCVANNKILEPGETANLVVYLENFSLCTTQMRNGVGTISTTNPDIIIEKATGAYPRIGVAGDVKSNVLDPFKIRVPVNAIANPFVEMQLSFASDQGDAELFFYLEIGERQDVVLLSQNFESGGFPALPAGWTSLGVAGAENEWLRDVTTALSGAQSAFCANVSVTSHNRLGSPAVFTSSFDEYFLQYAITFDLENDGPRRAWDGAVLMIEIDGVVHQAASIGTMTPFYSHKINEGNPAQQPLPGAAAWSGSVFPAWRVVTMRFRDLQNKTVRLFWDLATDYTGGTPRGVWIDDIVFSGRNYNAPASSCVDLTANPQALDLGSVQLAQTYCDSFFLVNKNAFAAVVVDSIKWSCVNPPITVNRTRVGSSIAPGDSAAVIVCITPNQFGAGSCNITVWNKSSNAVITVPVSWTAVATVIGIPGGAAAPFEIRSVAPNPFNPTTSISFTLPEAVPVTAEVWSVSGARVRTLAHNRLYGPGANAIEWDGRNNAGESVASGVYFIRIQNRLGSKVARAVLLK